MKQIKHERVKEIQTYDVVDLSVYNLELKGRWSNSDLLSITDDDLFYPDAETGLIQHNCLRKDFSMVNESFPQTDIILQAYKINEYMPKFYTDLVFEEITNKTIGILGYTFKADVDDIRDSLVPKLIRYIERHIPLEVLVNDPNLPGKVIDNYDDYQFENKSITEIIDRCDIIFVAINHESYKHCHFKKGQTIVDIWGLYNKGIVWEEK